MVDRLLQSEQGIHLGLSFFQGDGLHALDNLRNCVRVIGLRKCIVEMNRCVANGFPAHNYVKFLMLGAQLSWQRCELLTARKVIKHMHYFKLLSASALVIAISGCSSVAPKNPVDADLQHPVYAELKQEGSGWEFTRLSGDSSGVGEISVNLGTGKPLLDTGSEKCETWLWNPYHSDDIFTPCEKDTFRGAEMTNSTVPMYLLNGGMSVGLAWVLGIAPMESRFLWDEYNDALSEAYDNSGLTPRSLAELSEKFDTIDAVAKQSNRVCRNIASLKSDYESQYKKQYADRIGEYIKLNDKSGFFGKYKNVDPIEWVSADVRLPGYRSFQESCFSKMMIDTPADARQAGIILDKAIKSQQQRLSRVQSDMENYERLLMSGGVLAIRCNAGGRENNFVYTSNCDDEVSFNSEQFASNPSIDFTITGRDFTDVMPSAYNSSDANIEVELNGGRALINNRTDKYVSIEALSLSYNDRVLTLSGTDGQLYELAPGARVQLYLSKFDLDQLPNDFRNLTASEAERRAVHFALSAKYRITEIGYSKTLHKVENYPLATLL